MAKATRIDAPPVAQPPPTFVLELSLEEAQLVALLAGSIVGNPKWRERGTGIYQELGRALPYTLRGYDFFTKERSSLQIKATA